MEARLTRRRAAWHSEHGQVRVAVEVVVADAQGHGLRRADVVDEQEAPIARERIDRDADEVRAITQHKRVVRRTQLRSVAAPLGTRVARTPHAAALRRTQRHLLIVRNVDVAAVTLTRREHDVDRAVAIHVRKRQRARAGREIADARQVVRAWRIAARRPHLVRQAPTSRVAHEKQVGEAVAVHVDVRGAVRMRELARRRAVAVHRERLRDQRVLRSVPERQRRGVGRHVAQQVRRQGAGGVDRERMRACGCGQRDGRRKGLASVVRHDRRPQVERERGGCRALGHHEQVGVAVVRVVGDHGVDDVQAVRHRHACDGRRVETKVRMVPRMHRH